jgi:hypothetical protein
MNDLQRQFLHRQQQDEFCRLHIHMPIEVAGSVAETPAVVYAYI